MRSYGQPPRGQEEKGPQKREQTPGWTQLEKAPTGREVQLLHKNSDVDSREEAQHHTLGTGPAQASPGDHNHRDGRSMPILDGVAITGTTIGTNSVVLKSIIAALVELGATDGST